MVYIGGRTLAARAGAEMLGSLMTYCLAVGSLSNALLPRTKGEGMGLLAIALGVGVGIGLPIAMFYRVSAYFNPGILLAEAVRGNVGGAGAFFALLFAELAGYFTGALVLYAHYLPHFNAAVQLPAADEVDRLLRDPAALNDVALMNASYNLHAPSVTTPASFWRFALADARKELGRAARARKVADPFRTCPEDMAQACKLVSETSSTDAGALGGSKVAGDSCGGSLHKSHSLGAGGVPAGAATGEELSNSGAHADAELGWRQQQQRQQGRGGPGALQHDTATEGGGGAAPTYAERMRVAGASADGGAAERRGQLAAALCKARQDVLLSVFVTRPAVWSPLFNLLQEFVAMAIMATGALLLFEQGRYMEAAAGSAYPTQAALLVGLLNTVAVLALGGPTGPAMNPARDLGPRLAFHLLPIPGKGCSEWYYGWIPVVGGLAGGAAAGGLVAAISLLIAGG